MTLDSDLLFVLSHATEAVTAELASAPMDAIEKVLYDTLAPTLDQVTPFSVYSQMADILMRRLEHPPTSIRMLQLIQRIIALDPRKHHTQ
jgi:hypothetical protein